MLIGLAVGFGFSATVLAIHFVLFSAARAERSITLVYLIPLLALSGGFCVAMAVMAYQGFSPRRVVGLFLGFLPLLLGAPFVYTWFADMRRWG